MTWLKLSDDFDLEAGQVGLSDAAFRTHVQGLLYVMRKETGGTFSARALMRFADTEDPERDAAELVAHGFWQETEDGGYRVVHHMEHQRTPEQLADLRARNAARQARFREHRGGKPPTPPKGSSSGVSNGVSGRVTSGLVWSGLDGPSTTKPSLEGEARTCAIPGCSGLAIAGVGRCMDHEAPPLAVVPDPEPDVEEPEELDPPETGWGDWGASS